MNNVDALKTLYTALGGSADDVANESTIVGVLNAISKKYDGDADAEVNADAIMNIISVLDNIIPQPTPSENNVKVVFYNNPYQQGVFSLKNSVEIYDMPEGYTNIGTEFNTALSLKEITLPSTLTTIVGTAFTGSNNLEKITIKKAEGSISGAPWGAPQTTQVIWTG